MSEAPVLFETRGPVGWITLNRPKALNALTLEMGRLIEARLRLWADDPAVAAVAIDGAGDKAFCAGGDIRALHDASAAGDRAFVAEFYGLEYRLNRLIKTYPKPYVALIAGITMGGGVGLSVHGSHRVATERTLFAMPETGIGFFPDVGATHFLPRMRGGLGMYLGLTGARLKGADSLYAGVATHLVEAAALPDLATALTRIAPGAGPADAAASIAAVLAGFAARPPEGTLAPVQGAIDATFLRASLPEVLAALGRRDDAWAAETLATLRSKSPTALAVTFRQLAQGGRLDFDEAMRLEYRLALRVALSPDFREGVRAVIVDKDNAPRWNPASVDAVDPAAVDACFAPLDGDELRFD